MMGCAVATVTSAHSDCATDTTQPCWIAVSTPPLVLSLSSSGLRSVCQMVPVSSEVRWTDGVRLVYLQLRG